jgi:hypothetical protein
MQYNLRGYARQELLAVAQDAVREAQRNAPVRTGELRDSIRAQHEMIGGTGIMIAFVADTYYAVCQEKGFKHMPDGNWIPGKFFLRHAVESHKPMFMDAIRKAVHMAIKTG